MKISPRYEGSPILDFPGVPADSLAATVRQRRRMESTLAGLADADWRAPSRCAAWTVRDVVAHLVGVNGFWHASIRAGLAGSPTRVLGSFDPARTPAVMVSTMATLPDQEVLDQFVASNDALLAAMTALGDGGWLTIAESPAGHVPIRVLAMHALWDAWIHERDIAIPLGLPCAAEDDEVAACLKYAAAISPALAIGFGLPAVGRLAVEGTDPVVGFVLAVGDSVRLADRVHGTVEVPCLRGPSVDLVEALSLRTPLPDVAPPEWRRMLDGLAMAFDAAP